MINISWKTENFLEETVSPDRLNDFDHNRIDVGKDRVSNIMREALQIRGVEAKFFTPSHRQENMQINK